MSDITTSAEDGLSGRRSLSLRLPELMTQQLQQIARSRGESMNSLIVAAVADLIGRPDYAPVSATADIHPQIARDAIRQGPEAIAPLKGIARHASNRGQVALASVLWAAAARLVTHESGPARGAAELAHTGGVAESSGHLELAVVLYEEALRLDPNNLEAVNRFGQLLHHLAQKEGDNVARYREAERQLARVTFLDNHAKLFHGWSALNIARADRDADREERAVAEIEEALKSWAFGQRDGHERLSWLRQVRRLGEMGLEPEARALVAFANRNARWEPIRESELVGLGQAQS
jgi:tetratricopeptide (TPR) repeat protein